MDESISQKKTTSQFDLYLEEMIYYMTSWIKIRPKLIHQKDLFSKLIRAWYKVLLKISMVKFIIFLQIVIYFLSIES